jgi:hypothetical protein
VVLGSTLRRFKEGQVNGRRPKLVLVCIYHLLGSQRFQNGRIHGECMNKTKLSVIPLFLICGSLYHDISEIQMAKYTNTKYLYLCNNMIYTVYRKVKKHLKLDECRQVIKKNWTQMTPGSETLT